jgi:nicotinamidase-related amidase
MARHNNTLDPERCALLIVDMQEAFRPAIHEFDKILGRIVVMTRAASLLNLPILITEQSPQKLGRTVAEITGVLPPAAQAIPKTAFSCCGSESFLSQMASTRATQVLVAGIEAHVCVNQTVHDLLARDVQVHLIHDAVSSRTPENRAIGIEKMTRSGALPSSTETALFELMRDANHEQFRAIQKLIR